MTKACARRPGAAANVERRRREHRTLLAGAAGELAGATRLRQARPSRACTFSAQLGLQLGHAPHAPRTGAAARESPQRDRYGELTSPASHACGSVSSFRTHRCHSSDMKMLCGPKPDLQLFQHLANKRTMVGILLVSAYVSERKFTKSTSCPITLTTAVSKCLDCSGFAAMVAMRDTAWPRRCKYVFTNSANTTPVHVSSAMSMSCDWRPRICKAQTQKSKPSPPALGSTHRRHSPSRPISLVWRKDLATANMTESKC